MNKNTFLHSVRRALGGIVLTFRRERNFKIHALFALIALCFAFVFKISPIEWIIIIILIAFVWALELINTAVEILLDVAKPRLSEHVKRIKDCMAAAVLCASLGSALAGIILFSPYLIEWLDK
ncbi:MAG: diacylglycerol kinase [Candidatus Magasanikbacteria bacterium]|nr:diacylglycerol kinase [Candidatus Magasanikbacteria bacterium]